MSIYLVAEDVEGLTVEVSLPDFVERLALLAPCLELLLELLLALAFDFGVVGLVLLGQLRFEAALVVIRGGVQSSMSCSPAWPRCTGHHQRRAFTGIGWPAAPTG